MNFQQIIIKMVSDAQFAESVKAKVIEGLLSNHSDLFMELSGMSRNTDWMRGVLPIINVVESIRNIRTHTGFGLAESKYITDMLKYGESTIESVDRVKLDSVIAAIKTVSA